VPLQLAVPAAEAIRQLPLSAVHDHVPELIAFPLRFAALLCAHRWHHVPAEASVAVSWLHMTCIAASPVGNEGQVPVPALAIRSAQHGMTGKGLRQYNCVLLARSPINYTQQQFMKRAVVCHSCMKLHRQETRVLL
jgi:hypothetical protein